MKSYTLTIFLGVLGGILTILGTLFKIQHWPYGSLLITTGFVLIVLAALYAIIVAVNQKSD